MKTVMYTLDEVRGKLAAGQKLILAGAERVMRQLPQGAWIGGSIPYFMAENGGVFTEDKIFLTELPSYIKEVSFQKYSAADLSRVYKDAPVNGFSLIIIPSSSTTHLSFALNAHNFEEFATKPLIGWISGIPLDGLGKVSPKVFYGETGEMLEDGAVVMHVELPEGKYAEINIVNIFQQSGGDTITFPEDGFGATEAFVNGRRENLADYIVARNIDTRLPLVADYYGVMINTSFQAIDKAARKVSFYAPVFSDIEYKLAAPVAEYVTAFNSQMPQEDIDKIFFSCNCILNYLYSELEGKQTGGVVGPVTFGEIAYQLLNQTMAYLTIRDL